MTNKDLKKKILAIETNRWGVIAISKTPTCKLFPIREAVMENTSFLPKETKFNMRIQYVLCDQKEIKRCICGCNKPVKDPNWKYLQGHIFNCPEGKEKIKAGNLRNNGSELPSQSEKVKKKYKENCLIKYGVDNPAKSKEVQDKTKITNLKRYGVEFSSQSEEVKKKIRATNLEKYGFESASKSQVVKDKVKKTSLERFGKWYSQTEEHHSSMYKMKEYKLPSGRIVKVQGFEPQALDYLLKTYKEEDLLIDKNEMKDKIGEIWYSTSDGKTHRYFPDIYIIPENKILEIKSTYTIKADKDKNTNKQKECLKRGFKFEFLIFDFYGNFIESKKLALV